MGKPIKIYDLAVQMIKMSGYKPDEDIEIMEIGLRPGEKLYEELLLKVDEMEKTENDLIFIEHCEPFSREEVDVKLELLKSAMRKSGNCGDAVKNAMAKAVPTYVDPDTVNEHASESEEMKMALDT
jgi:FlaA1/EpsC-like NDP-sugar epimerase